uniref:TACC_C domain-containing protein n=1 Tax=Steinernema glaseri TaxID=37863 RepID=A0A1I7ZIM0_9BILA
MSLFLYMCLHHLTTRASTPKIKRIKRNNPSQLGKNEGATTTSENVNYASLSDFDPFMSESDRELLVQAGYNASTMSFPRSFGTTDARSIIRGPFAGKKKQLKPIFTFSEIRQACAETSDAFELIHQAKRYLNEQQKPLSTEN